MHPVPVGIDSAFIQGNEVLRRERPQEIDKKTGRDNSRPGRDVVENSGVFLQVVHRRSYGATGRVGVASTDSMAWRKGPVDSPLRPHGRTPRRSRSPHFRVSRGAPPRDFASFVPHGPPPGPRPPLPTHATQHPPPPPP